MASIGATRHAVTKIAKLIVAKGSWGGAGGGGRTGKSVCAAEEQSGARDDGQSKGKKHGGWPKIEESISRRNVAKTNKLNSEASSSSALLFSKSR